VRAEIRVARAAIAGVPAGVDVELAQVRQPPDLLGTRRLAAGQRAKRVEVDGLRPLRLQVRVEEPRVAELVVGVVGDVLRHVPVEVRQRRHVARVAAVCAPELVVLLPQIAFDQLGSGQEAQDGDVAIGDPAGAGDRFTREQRAAGQRRSACQTDTHQERASSDDALPLGVHVVFEGRGGLALGRANGGGVLGHDFPSLVGVVGLQRVLRAPSSVIGQAATL
jgi:hypothetical protein